MTRNASLVAVGLGVSIQAAGPANRRLYSYCGRLPTRDLKLGSNVCPPLGRRRLLDQRRFEQRLVDVLRQRNRSGSLCRQSLLVVGGARQRHCVGAGSGLPETTDPIGLNPRVPAHLLDTAGEDLGRGISVAGFLSLRLANECKRSKNCSSSGSVISTGSTLGSAWCRASPRDRDCCFRCSRTGSGSLVSTTNRQAHVRGFVHAEASADASPARCAAGRPCDQPSTPAADQPLVPRAFRRRS